MAKAQAEFTTGVMKNETVRQAAGMNFYLFYMYFLNGGLKSKRLHLIIDFHEFSSCESSNFLIERRIFHKNHICNLFVLRGLS